MFTTVYGEKKTMFLIFFSRHYFFEEKEKNLPGDMCEEEEKQNQAPGPPRHLGNGASLKQIKKLLFS